MSSLTQFLLLSRKALTYPSKLHVVLGNEACDLDSAVSAITYAFLLHSLQTKSGDSTDVIPILNIPREDYPLRTEVRYWFQKLGIEEEQLVFRDEIQLHDLHSTGGLQITLVDHNVLPSVDQTLEPAVVFVIDHHQLERKVEPDGAKMVHQMVGSCCTLVAERIFEKNQSVLDPVVARLLHGTILLDTVNLNEKAKRVTPMDVEVIQKLEELIQPAPDRDEIFRDLTSAKGDISTLTSGQLLRKDRKVVTSPCGTTVIGMSSLPMMVEEYLQRPDAGATLKDHCTNLKEQAAVLMGSRVVAEGLKRDLAVFGADPQLGEELSKYLVSAQDELLRLTEVPSEVAQCHAFRQGNHAASRKVVLPLIKDWLARRNL